MIIFEATHFHEDHHERMEHQVEEQDETSAGLSRIRYYADILNPLFWHKDFSFVHRLFEWVCTLLRVTGLKDTGWDSYTESIALLEDFAQLQLIDLPSDKFPHPSNTRARLALISYSHLIEMDGPYELLTNLLRVRLGMKYHVHPLAHLNRIEGGKNKPKRVIAASPSKKIEYIQELAKQAEMPEVGAALKAIYDGVIRNAVFHSDYAIHNNSMRLLSSSRFSKKENMKTRIVTFDELAEVTNDAFAFHSALFQLWKRQLTLVTTFRGKILPYDDHYKGVLEFTYTGDSLDGFRVYWPNGMVGSMTRDSDGRSSGQNTEFRSDGSLDFFVGLYASNPGSFSPLVEEGASPNYAEVPGTNKRPHWPDDLKLYEL
jgi:hypothetical protein